MSASRSLYFSRDERGASAAEFAMVLPLILLFLFGIIDMGRYAWAINQAEKATHIGARWAVTTDIIPGAGLTNGLYSYDFTDKGIDSGGVVGPTDFPGVFCQTNGAGALACTCSPSGTCSGFSIAVTNIAARNAWDALVGRMQEIHPAIGPRNVRIDYDNAGLGFAGDPNGPNVAPLVTVSLRDLRFQPIAFLLFDGTLPMPAARYSLTMEDGRTN